MQKQLIQMGVSGDSMRRALQQISQRAEVQLSKLTSEEMKMYTQWYVLYFIFCSVTHSWQEGRFPSSMLLMLRNKLLGSATFESL